MIIQKQIDSETLHEYTFGTFSLPKIIFTGFAIKKKPPRKRIWITEYFWDKYRERESKLSEPELPHEIKQLAIEKIASQLDVLTFKQYKGE